MSDIPRMVIEFSPEGRVEAMNQESVLPLGFLGTQEITRASELIFDSATQAWGIHVADGAGGFHPPYPEATGFQTYEDARIWEVQWFTECRARGVKPQSEEGREVLKAMHTPANF